MIKMIRISPILSMHSSSIISRVCQYFCSSLSVFDSQYHHKGLLPMKKPKNVERLLKDINWQLDNKINQIQQQRTILNQKNLLIKSKQNYSHLKQKSKQLQDYLLTYQNLAKTIEKCQLNNQWIYKLIGWYNISHYYKPLIERLLQSKGSQTEFLIDALSMMKYQWKNSYGVIDEELRTNRKIQKFYKELSSELSFDYLKKLQNIVIVPLVITKRNYYQIYAAKHLQDWLKTIRDDNKQEIDKIIWLFERCIINMMDQQYIISKLEKFLLTTKIQLSHQNIQKLMNIYNLKGRINKNIYNEYISKYISKQKMKNLPNIIQSIKFIICSQCQDNKMLKNLYQMLDVHYQNDKMKLKNSRDKYHLHLYTHYLRIKGYTIKLHQQLEKEINQFCRQKAEGRQALNKIVLQNKSNAIRDKNKYYSQCLKIKNYTLKQYDTTKRSVFQSNFRFKLLQIQLDEMKIYEKPILCCFELDFCLHKSSSNELTDIQIDGMQYVFSSGRLIRSRQIRDEILTHYGVKIHHIDYNSFKSRQKISQEELLMNRRLFIRTK